MKTEQNFRLVAGDNLTVQFAVKKPDGSVLSLAGAVVTVVFSSAFGYFLKSSSDAEQLLVTNFAQGQFELYLIPSDTAGQSNHTFGYEAKVVLSGETVTVAKGIMEVS